MTMRSRKLSGAAVSLTGLVVACAFAGCSAGDVELNGKLFDAVGATGLMGKPSGKVNMAERQPLIVPPALDRLPAPGAALPEGVDVTKQVVDPERAKVASAAELERQQRAYCKEHYELAKMRGDSNADAVRGPLGLCRPSALSAFEKWNKSEPEPEVAETADQGAAVPAATGSIGTVSEAAPAPAAKPAKSAKRTGSRPEATTAR